jgi:hypothetical protein
VKAEECNSYLCLVHADCPDGTAAAWVFREWVLTQHLNGMGVAFQIVPVTYNNPPPEITAPVHLVILDFTYDVDTTRQLIDHPNVVSFTLLDHHPRAWEIRKAVLGWVDTAKAGGGMRGLVDKPILAVHEEYQSGAMMAWNHFFPKKPVPDLIAHVSDRDLWQFDLPDTRNFMDGLRSYALNLDTWDEVFKEYSPYTGALKEHLLTQAPAFQRMQEAEINEVINSTKRIVVFKHVVGALEIQLTFPIINCRRTIMPEALMRLCDESPSVAASYHDTAEYRIISLRSKMVDIRWVAEFFGGGGHPHACSFRVPRSHPIAQL